MTGPEHYRRAEQLVESVTRSGRRISLRNRWLGIQFTRLEGANRGWSGI